MKITQGEAGRACAVCFVCVYSVFCVGCKTSEKSDASERGMKQTAVIPHTGRNDPYAISPDGSLLVHAQSGIMQSQRVLESILDVREVKSANRVAAIRLDVAPNTGFQFHDFELCDHGRYLLAIGPVATIFPSQDPTSMAGDLITSMSEDFIKILDMKTYRLHANISLSDAEHAFPPEERARYSTFNKEWHGVVSFAACAANAPIAATVIDYGGMATVKIFNLETGVETPGFGGMPNQRRVRGLAVSPLGSSLALFRDENMPGGNGLDAADHCITVVDLQNKRIARTIWVRSDRDTNSITYAGESTVATELSIMEMENQAGRVNGLYPFRYRVSVHFFDISSGSEVRVISDPDAEDFKLQGISADGRTMLAYTGRSHQCESCNHGQGQPVITDARFTLWKPETGALIAKSPELMVVHHTCPWFSLQDWIWKSCISSDEAPTLKLSQDGKTVAASWPSGGQPIDVYSVPSH